MRESNFKATGDEAFGHVRNHPACAAVGAEHSPRVPAHRARFSRLTGNRVTSLTCLQTLSENRPVCQEALRSPFTAELPFVCLSAPAAALRTQSSCLAFVRHLLLVGAASVGAGAGGGLALGPCRTALCGRKEACAVKTWEVL